MDLPKVVTQLLPRVGFKPTTCRSQVQCFTHCATVPPMTLVLFVLFSHFNFFEASLTIWLASALGWLPLPWSHLIPCFHCSGLASVWHFCLRSCLDYITANVYDWTRRDDITKRCNITKTHQQNIKVIKRQVISLSCNNVSNVICLLQARCDENSKFIINTTIEDFTGAKF